MKIKELNIISFGALKNKRISFCDNFNVVYGTNESGKTTISAFIEAMLYSFPPRSDRSKYLPWDNTTAAGEMSVDINGTTSTIYRKFAQSPKGDVLEPENFSFEGSVPPDRESYRKSIYSPEGKISQFGVTDNINSALAASLSSCDDAVSISAAVKRLEKERRSLNSGNKLKNLDNTISRLENEYFNAKNEEKRIAEYKNRLYEKKQLLKKYEELAASHHDTSQSASHEKLKCELRLQEEYIRQFPRFSEPPQRTAFSKTSLFFYIICTFTMFSVLFFAFPELSPLSFIPLSAYFVYYFISTAKYKRALKAFLNSVQCDSIDEYEKMYQDKIKATEYYDKLQKELSDYSLRRENEKAELYKKILTVRSEIDNLYTLTQTSSRDMVTIEEELSYYNDLKQTLSLKLDAIRVAIDAFNHAKDVITSDFTPRVTKTASEYLNLIAPKDRRSVSLKADMSLIVSDPIRCDLSNQSFGFREEASLCFRLAWSELLYGNSFPVILDDPFLGSDDFREKKLIDLLYSISQERQVIIFTNRKNPYFNQIRCNFVDITPLSDV